MWWAWSSPGGSWVSAVSGVSSSVCGVSLLTACEGGAVLGGGDRHCSAACDCVCGNTLAVAGRDESKRKRHHLHPTTIEREKVREQ